MKNNHGITIITLIITIIIIVLIASITIYSGISTLGSIREKEAKDTTNAIYLSLIANENMINAVSGEAGALSDAERVDNRLLTNKDYEILGLDYTTDKCEVSFDKYPSGENIIVYNFTYKNGIGNTYENLIYTSYKKVVEVNTTSTFDTVKGVNRPLLYESTMQPIGYDGNIVEDIYTEAWYDYNKGVSKLAVMRYDGNNYVWIPRFAYKIQEFYLGKSYATIPETAVDIVFLREGTNYMSNNEVLQKEYVVHPAFSSGESGFWIMIESAGIENSISNAASSADISLTKCNGHLMKNSEYAATIFLMKYLKNSQVIFDDAEFVAAICDSDSDIENFDIYSENYNDSNYINNILGQALLDTPWNLTATPVMPNTTNKYMLRDVGLGGYFYYQSTAGVVNAAYRIVIAQ